MAKDRTLGLKLKAIDRMSGAIDRVQKKFPQLSRSIRRANNTAKIFNAQTKQMRQSLNKTGGALKNFGRNATFALTLPILAAGGASLKAFGDFEQGLKGVEKTTGIAGPQLEMLANNFDKLSTEIPVSTAEMLELAQAGGQLGINTVPQLEKFTVTMSKLSRASNVAGEEGAKSIARILTVTGDGVDQVDKFAASLVQLGNTAAASESEILGVANRVAGAIGRFDVGSDQALGISTALKALGKEAEASGSVIGRAFDSIDQAIKKGTGPQIQLLSKLTDIPQNQLAQAFEKDAAKVFQSFIGGLGKVEKGGGNLIEVMKFMGLEGVRINDILGTLAKRPEVLAENMNTATVAFKENAALNKEFAVQISTFNSEMKTLGNTLVSLGRMIGRELAPAIGFLGGLLKSFLNFLRDNPGMRKFVIVMGALAVVLGPIIAAFGVFLTMLPAMATGMAMLSTASLPITGSFLAIAAGVAAAIAALTLIIAKWDQLVKFFDSNPILSVAKSMFLLLNPIGHVITAVKLLISTFSGLDAVKNTVRDILPKFVSDRIFGQANTLGESIGARSNLRAAAAPRSEAQQVSGNIGVNFRNLPEGAQVRSEFSGPLDFDLGFAGVPQ